MAVQWNCVCLKFMWLFLLLNADFNHYDLLQVNLFKFVEFKSKLQQKLRCKNYVIPEKLEGVDSCLKLLWQIFLARKVGSHFFCILMSSTKCSFSNLWKNVLLKIVVDPITVQNLFSNYIRSTVKLLSRSRCVLTNACRKWIVGVTDVCWT